MIVVFGSINLDLVARVTRLPHAGETLAGESFAALPGGKGANQALAARRAGAEVTLIGAVGADPFAEIALSGLAVAGVDLGRIRRSDKPTGVAMIHVDADGENCITAIAGANADACPADVPSALMRPGNTLLMQLEVPIEHVAAVSERARRAGARVMLNAAPARPIPEALLAASHVLVVNETEAAAIAAELGLEPAPRAFARGVYRRFGCASVVTLGAQGAIAALDVGWLRAPAPTVPVVDTVGAGDAFSGALAAALDRGATWARSLAEAVAAGSLACRSAGAQDALPDAPEIANLSVAIESKVQSDPLP